MTEDKRFELEVNNNGQFDIVDRYESKKKNAICIYNDLGVIPFSSASSLCDLLNQLNDENEELKKGMIGVVDRYIKNVECNPPSSARTYMKIKGALINIREDLRNLIEDFE